MILNYVGAVINNTITNVLFSKTFAATGGLTFFKDGIKTVQKVVIAIGIGLGIYGGIQLFEGYANDNPGSKAQGIKQLIAGGGIVLFAGLFNTLATALS